MTPDQLLFSTAAETVAPQEVSTFSAADSSPQGVAWFDTLVCLLGMVGILGNGFVLVIMLSQKKTRKQITGTLVINQSLVDLTCSFFLVITNAYKTRPVGRYNRYGREVICYLIVDEILLFNSMNASTYCLMVITLERYFMIVLPIQHRNSFTQRRAIVMAALAWAAGYLWNTPATLYSTSVVDGDCQTFVWGNTHAQSIFGITYMAATFFVPTLMFAMAYSHMGWVLRKRAAQLGVDMPAPKPDTAGSGTTSTNHAADAAPGRKRPPQQKTKLTKAQVNVTKTMVMVTAAFVICWTPNQIYYLLFNLGYSLNFTSPGYMITLFLSFINSCINPFIYAFKLESFRRGLKLIPCIKARQTRGLSGDSMSVQTVNSNM